MKYMLAPIEDYTDSCFRTVCKDADLYMTELVRVQSLARNNKPSLNRIKLYDNIPTQIQLLGQKENDFKKFLETFKPEQGFKGFNLNLGCPAPNFVKQGIGCAMIKRTSKVKRIIELIKSYNHKVSIKMRLGLNQYEKERKVYLNLINEVDADFFVVHARHGTESYNIKADHSVFEEIVKTGKNIVANGDIKTKEDVNKLSFCYGVMIGRAAIKNPTIFSELKGLPLKPIQPEYDTLLKERNVDPKYRKNVLELNKN